MHFKPFSYSALKAVTCRNYFEFFVWLPSPHWYGICGAISLFNWTGLVSVVYKGYNYPSSVYTCPSKGLWNCYIMW